MQVYVYLDESGCIHKNSNTKYFAVGGYFSFKEDKNRIVSIYKKINKEIKDFRGIALSKEIKSYDMNNYEKIKIFKEIQKIKSFCGFSIIFNKEEMKMSVENSNVFYNYAVKLIFEDCIIPLLDLKNISEKITFIVSADNRNVGVGKLKNLEDYLITEFCLYGFDFNVTYYQSDYNFGVQLADLIVNTFYNSHKNYYKIKDVLLSLRKSKFRISLFPSFQIKGRNKFMEKSKKTVDV